MWAAEWGYRTIFVDKLAASAGLPFCLITPSALKFENPSLTQIVDLLSAISKQNRNVLLYPHYMLLMLITTVFFGDFL